MDITWDEIVEELSLFGTAFSDDIIPERCIHLCKKHSWSPSDFCDQWLAWTKSKNIMLDSETLEKMISDVEKSMQNVAPPQKTPSHTATVGQKRAGVSIKSPIVQVGTPKRQFNGNSSLCASFTDGTDSTPARVYKTGKRTGQIIANHKGQNYHAVEDQSTRADSIEIKILNDIELTGRLQNKNRTEMNLAVLERLGRMKEVFPLDDKELKDISGGFLSEGDVVYGMLRPPMKTNLPFQLYGDYEVSRSSSTPVFPKFPAFPGQVILAKVGHQANQAKFLKDPIEPQLPPLPPAVHLKHPLKIIVAAGPYTTLDTLSYEPYHDFISQLVQEEPDIAILVGPFVDAHHKKLSTNLDCCFEEYFQQLIERLVSKLAGKRTRLYIVANYKENHTTSRGFPTDKYNCLDGANVTCLNDPALLDVNGIQIGVSSTDIFRGLTESFVNVDENVEINRLCAKTILQQRSLYPLFPPHTEICLRLPLMNQMMINVRPHILVLPATVAPFAFGEEKCLFVNPGTLVKGMDAGSYGIIDIAPFSGESVVDATQVKITRV